MLGKAMLRPGRRPVPVRQGVRRDVLAGLACGLAVALGGCDPRVFDDLAGETWADSSGPPEGLSSQLYAVAIAGGGAAPEQGARFFVAGRLQDAFVHLRYDAGGALAQTSLPLRDVGGSAVNPLAQQPVLVGDAASSLVAVALSNGSGSAGGAERAQVLLLDGDTGQRSATISLPGPELITALGFGSTDVSGGGRNMALVRGDLLVVVADVASPEGTALPACRLGAEGGTSLVIADLQGAAADEIALATAGGGAAQVIVTTGKLVEDAAATAAPDAVADCFADGRQPLLVIDAPGGEADFGQRMVAADFNGNGTPDLAVSAPSGNGSGMIYVYLDVAGGAGNPIEIPAPEGAGGFGLAMAAGNLDGADGDELVIGAPATAQEGVTSAGAVYLYVFSGDDFGVPYVLADAEPEDDQRFGQSVAAVPFGATREILTVGASKEVFTYFRTPVSGDVRP